MQRRGQKTTFQERIVISELAEAGHSDPEIATYMGCSVWTVRKWRRIFEHKGRDGLTTQMGRPATGVLSTMLPELQTKLRALREAHPGWGPESLLATLRADPAGAQLISRVALGWQPSSSKPDCHANINDPLTYLNPLHSLHRLLMRSGKWMLKG